MPCKVAVVGACTLVGRELLKTLSDRSFPLSQIRLFDIEHSVGQKLVFNTNEILVEEITEHVLKEEKFSFIFFTGCALLSEQYIPIASQTNAYIIDVSSYSRHSMKSPLIVPEINASKMEGHKVFANPLCFSTQLSLVLHPLNKISSITRAVVSTYQAVSGAGFFGVEEFERQIIEIENGKEANVHFLPKQIAFNVVPQVDRFIGDDSWTKEELEIIEETKTLLERKELDMAITCVRVPVIRGHSASIMVEFSDDVSLEDIINTWENEEIVVYHDDYPTPWEMEGTVDVAVGRIRKDLTRNNCFHFWCVADNLARGTALNSIQIAEELL